MCWLYEAEGMVGVFFIFPITLLFTDFYQDEIGASDYM